MDVLIPDMLGFADARELLMRVAHVLAEDERVSACTLSGSFATGMADEYSDIDLDVLLDPRRADEFYSDLPKILVRIGPVLAYRETKWADKAVFVHFEDVSMFRRLDLHFYHSRRFSFPPSRVAYEMLFERDGASLPVIGSDEEVQEIDPQDFLQRRIVTFLMQRMVNVRELKRGNIWHAHDSAQTARLQVVDMLRCIYTPDRIGAGTRDLEADLPQDVLTDLRNLVPGLSRESIAQSTMASLSFVDRYIKPYFKVNNMAYPERLAAAVRELCRSELEEWVE